VFWKRTTKLAVNFILSAGSAFSLFVGMLNLWILPPDEATGANTWWPHYFLISFYIFAILFVAAILISLLDKNKVTAAIETAPLPKTDKQVKILFVLLGLVILSLYIIFNGH
jgi:SSS family solute:Na+ symporter